MINKIYTVLFCLLMLIGCSKKNAEKTSTTLQNKAPNIVYILADDLGYGDVAVNNPNSTIPTPNIDRLAGQGIRFTDAHAPSSVCTPSRYGLMTGRYCWRSRLPQGVVQGYGRALIDKNQLTIGTFLQSHGYFTGVIGKWHLGLNWVLKPGHKSDLKVPANNPDHARMVQNINPKDIDFTKPVTDGPPQHGFNYSYILPASLDMQPYCYLRNDTLTEPLTEHTNGNDLHPKGTPLYATGPFWRPGLMAKDFNFTKVLPNFTNHAVSFIKRHAHSSKPFFLYFAMPSPHTPWLPEKQFIGKSHAGPYGDYIVEVDAMVGKVLSAIQKSGISSNTIIVFTSDNGPYWRPAFVKKYHHHAAYVFRGMKADAWEGGHRIPFIVKWPGKIKAGSVSHITTTLTNLIATCSDLITGKNKVNHAVDSYSILPALLGKKDTLNIPQAIINESSHGLYAVRDGKWKLIEGLGSGGFSLPVWVKPRPGGPKGQLYNLFNDSSETRNLYLSDPNKVKQLQSLMDSIKSLSPAEN